jgi:peptidoglycan/xylan/chitin deacetylase (PgdA/CDA1 family)
MEVKQLIYPLEEVLASLCLRVWTERNSFLSFLFHGLFETADELRSGVVDPQQGITVEMFRTFVRYFRSESYLFISPADIAKGLSTAGRRILITFDDGYYNNSRALPILEEFDIPAVFFISTSHVKHEKAFWWDVVYREHRRRGCTAMETRSAIAAYKRLKTAAVESQLKEAFGDDVFRPIGDLDRPFSAEELSRFGRHRYVFLGNHTRDHAILTNYSEMEIREQIHGAQEDIREMTGQIPTMIAYPNGNVSAEIQSAALESGLDFGVGVRPGNNPLPVKIPSTQVMNLRRYTLWGDRGIEQQCRVCRSGLSFSRLLQGMKVSSAYACQ